MKWHDASPHSEQPWVASACVALQPMPRQHMWLQSPLSLRRAVLSPLSRSCHVPWRRTTLPLSLPMPCRQPLSGALDGQELRLLVHIRLRLLHIPRWGCRPLRRSWASVPLRQRPLQVPQPAPYSRCERAAAAPSACRLTLRNQAFSRPGKQSNRESREFEG